MPKGRAPYPPEYRRRMIEMARSGDQLDPAEVFGFVKANRAWHRVSTMCRTLDVSASGYYASLERPPSAGAQEDEKLVQLRIREIHLLRPSMGSVATATTTRCARASSTVECEVLDFRTFRSHAGASNRPLNRGNSSSQEGSSRPTRGIWTPPVHWRALERP